jgi:hypothetical protein
MKSTAKPARTTGRSASWHLAALLIPAVISVCWFFDNSFSASAAATASASAAINGAMPPPTEDANANPITTDDAVLTWKRMYQDAGEGSARPAKGRAG